MLLGKFQPKCSYCSLKQRFLYQFFHPSLPLQWSAESKGIFICSFFGVFTVLIFVDQFNLTHFSSLVADLSLKKKVFPFWIIQTFAGYKNASLALSTANCFFQVADSNPWVCIMGLTSGKGEGIKPKICFKQTFIFSSQAPGFAFYCCCSSENKVVNVFSRVCILGFFFVCAEVERERKQEQSVVNKWLRIENSCKNNNNIWVFLAYVEKATANFHNIRFYHLLYLYFEN